MSAEQMSEESEQRILNSIASWSGGEGCKPTLEVGFSEIRLSTNCPEKAHLLKFAYHSSWKASSGAEIFNVSPGYMALIPGTEKVILRFGQSVLWRFSNYLSWLGMFISALWFLGARARTRSR